MVDQDKRKAKAAHDEAIAVFPTSLLSPAFGFRAAGRLNHAIQ